MPEFQYCKNMKKYYKKEKLKKIVQKSKYFYTIITHLASQTHPRSSCKRNFAGQQIALTKSQYFGVLLKLFIWN